VTPIAAHSRFDQDRDAVAFVANVNVASMGECSGASALVIFGTPPLSARPDRGHKQADLRRGGLAAVT
jgi:hypothetical protein